MRAEPLTDSPHARRRARLQVKECDSIKIKQGSAEWVGANQRWENRGSEAHGNLDSGMYHIIPTSHTLSALCRGWYVCSSNTIWRKGSNVAG